MHQPQGFIKQGEEHLVCKLEKSLYGLKQSGRVWHNTLKGELMKLGFKSGDADPTIFFQYGDHSSIAIAGWYVDDGLLASNSNISMDQMITDISGSFDIQDLGEPECLLGIRIIRNKELGIIHISQPSYIDIIARRFNILPGKLISSPMSSSIILRPSSDNDNLTVLPYASLTGSINYCAIATRPDISYATNKCAQLTSKPRMEHWDAAKRIICYLLHTREYGIKYRRNSDKIGEHSHNLSGYTDSDFAGDTNNRKSTSGWVFMFNRAPISWASRKQSLVMRSSMEAELVAGSIASVEGIWIIKLGRDFHHLFNPIPLYTDNQSFIALSVTDTSNKRTKHIDTHYHYTREQINAGTIKLFYIPTLQNPADILIKPLPPNKHLHHLEILGMQHA